jgi:hypothetical protein
MKRFLKALAAVLSAALICAACAIPAFAAPTYEYSEVYKASKYYTALKAYERTGDLGKDIVGIAETQLGYHEGDSDADMDGANTKGSKNFVEYNRIYGKLDNNEGNGVSYGYAWCCAFVSWCLTHAGAPAGSFIVEVSCPRMMKFLSEKGRYFQSETAFLPKEGDLIFFGSSNSATNHIGIVTRVENNKVHTIEGNKLGMVTKASYNLNDDGIRGYGRILMEDGEYFAIQATDLFLPTGEFFATVPAGDTVKIVESYGATALVEYKGTQAIAKMTFLFPMNSLAFTVTYDTGDGKGAPATQHRRPGEELKLSENIPTFKGYTFLGWATKYGGEVAYQPGDKYSGDESIVLYAVWQANNYTVKFVNPDGSVISEAVYPYCGEVVAPEAPSMKSDGVNKFVFEKWDMTVQRYCFGDVTYTAVYTSVPLTEEEKAQLAASDNVEAGGCSSFSACGALAAALVAFAMIKKKKY